MKKVNLTTVWTVVKKVGKWDVKRAAPRVNYLVVLMASCLVQSKWMVSPKACSMT